VRGQSVAVHWGEECWESEENNEEECEFTDGEDDEKFELNENAFQKLFAGTNNLSASEDPRQLWTTHQYAYKTVSEEESISVTAGSNGFSAIGCWMSQALAKQKFTPNEEALYNLDKKLRSKKTKLTGYNFTHRHVVQSFLRYQETKKEGKPGRAWHYL
jgi:hypothetical protein